jgi:adenosine deaminase
MPNKEKRELMVEGTGQITEAFIRDLPKTDLHIHLDGSLRIPTLIECAKAQHIDMPSYEEEGLRALVFKQGYDSLEEYLHGFKYTCQILQDPESLERIAYELAWDNILEGVRYFEVRFAPMLHVNKKQNMTEVFEAVNRGLNRAKKEFNQQLTREGDTSPPFEYGIIACAMRMFTEGFSDYYRRFTQGHKYTPNRELYALASAELARAVCHIKRETNLPIVGFDLAGAEHGYPAGDHIDAFAIVHKNFIKKTVHAGEAYGPESIFQAITDLHADRIGHGYHLLDEQFVNTDKIPDPATYVRQLSQYLAESRVTIEVCLSSNMDTDPQLTSMADHPFRKMKELKLSTTLCTDNRLVSQTTMTRELLLAVKHFGLTPRELKNIIIYGFKRSFYPKDYRQKRIYVRRIIDYYSQIEAKHGIGIEPVNDY